MTFKSNIDQNRSAYNQVENVPADIIWMGIQQHTDKKVRVRRIRLYSIAASFLVIISVATTLMITGGNNSNNNFSSVMRSAENDFYRNASNKLDVIDFGSLDQEVYGEIIREYEIADSMYIELKNDIREMPDAEKAIELAIKYHERRLRILELIEREIENQKRFEQNEKEIKI